MSIMSDISIEIQDRLIDGQEPNVIARVMDIPISWVYVEEDSVDPDDYEIDYPDL